MGGKLWFATCNYGAFFGVGYGSCLLGCHSLVRRIFQTFIGGYLRGCHVVTTAPFLFLAIRGHWLGCHLLLRLLFLAFYRGCMLGCLVLLRRFFRCLLWGILADIKCDTTALFSAVAIGVTCWIAMCYFSPIFGGKYERYLHGMPCVTTAPFSGVFMGVLAELPCVTTAHFSAVAIRDTCWVAMCYYGVFFAVAMRGTGCVAIR